MAWRYFVEANSYTKNTIYLVLLTLTAIAQSPRGFIDTVESMLQFVSMGVCVKTGVCDVKERRPLKKGKNLYIFFLVAFTDRRKGMRLKYTYLDW